MHGERINLVIDGKKNIGAITKRLAMALAVSGSSSVRESVFRTRSYRSSEFKNTGGGKMAIPELFFVEADGARSQSSSQKIALRNGG